MLSPPPPPTRVDAAITRCRESTSYLVGAARSDITGPTVDISTGYTEPGVTMEGLMTRLYARAFVVESPCSGQRVVFVNADLLHTYQSIKTGVLSRLASRLPGVYDATTVMLSGTHDHSAPSNISFRTLYNLFNGVVGFDSLNYDVVVDGIVDAIVRAHTARRSATIRVATGRVPNAAHNRSRAAYLANPDAADYASDVDDTMTLLRFDATSGAPIGVLTFFGAHGTSLGADVHLVDGDSKGRAALQLEARYASAGYPSFVASFANSQLGDVSPNQPDPADPTGPFLRPSDLDPSLDAYDDARVHGAAQYEAAMSLLSTPGTLVKGGVFLRHRFVDFQGLAVGSAYGAPEGAKTCVAAIGAGFVAGTEEGGTKLIASLQEGDLVYQGIPINPVISPEVRRCHAEKQVVLTVGDVSSFWVDDVPWVDTIVPFHVVAIGNVALVGSSFEQTTMQGRRIRRVIGATLAPMGVSQVVVSTLTNAYHQYMTTREEYATQNFEGAFTHFGPHSGAAFLEQTDALARALVEGRRLDAGPTPPDLSNQQLVHTPIDRDGVALDAPGAGKAFGDVVTDAPATVPHGPTGHVSVTFVSAHPRTAELRQRAGALPSTFRYVSVERLVNGAWTRVATEDDPTTRYRWARTGGSLSPTSTFTIEWDLDAAAPGTYRIVHQGLAKKGLLPVASSYVAFSGASRAFVVQ